MSKASLNLTTNLSKILHGQIQQVGSISVAEFMSTALSHPEHGYYNTRDPFGRSGDFITAPEVSQMFGELIGLWAAAVWRLMGGPQNIRLIELGPGRGTLMADALRAIKQSIPEFCDKLCVDLVDISPVLKQCQSETLQQWKEAIDICWHDDLAAIPDGPSIIIANEFFDALPVHQYENTQEGWCERFVGLNENEDFCFTLGEELKNNSIIPENLRSASIGQIFESNLESVHVVERLCDRLKFQNGACLVVDYGHVKQGLGDTVQAVKNQKYHNLFQQIGEADLTAHVDFEAMSMTAADHGCQIFGPITQKTLLERLGIVVRAEQLKGTSESHQAVAVQQAYDRLIGEDEMGVLFKAMAFTNSSMMSIPGFE